MKTIETARMVLRTWRMEDAADLFAYACTPTVGPAAGWKSHENVGESEIIIQHFLAAGDVWAIEDRVSGRVIGSVGLHEKAALNGTVNHELGYVLAPDFEGSGRMTEACRAVLAYAFNDLGLSEVIVDHFVDNRKSRRVIEKLGFTPAGEILYQTRNYGERLSLHYRMTKERYIEQWRKWTMVKWNLDKLYLGFNDPAYLADCTRLKAIIGRYNAMAPQVGT
ncbi:MAG: GNAT family N-acetyltransferase, partial [bacterium]